MISRFEHQGIHWIDLENPTPEEIDEVALELNLGSMLTQDLLAPTAKPRVDLYPNAAYAVLHFPSLRYTRGASSSQEVDFVIGKKYLLTSHYDTVPAVYDLSRAFEAQMLLKHARSAAFGSGHLFLELAERLYSSVEDELEALEDSVNSAEAQIFSGHEKEMVVALSNLSRELLDHKRTLSHHKHVLDVLEQVSVMNFGEEYGNYLRGAKLFHARVYARALALLETIGELRKTNSALLSTRQNEIMKNLTIMTFVTAPLALTASIFGMNSASLPLINDPGGFWLVLGVMALIATCLAIYFRIKHWL